MFSKWDRGEATDDEVIRTLGISALEVFQSNRALHEQGTWADEDDFANQAPGCDAACGGPGNDGDCRHILGRSRVAPTTTEGSSQTGATHPLGPVPSDPADRFGA